MQFWLSNVISIYIVIPLGFSFVLLWQDLGDQRIWMLLGETWCTCTDIQYWPRVIRLVIFWWTMKKKNATYIEATVGIVYLKPRFDNAPIYTHTWIKNHQRFDLCWQWRKKPGNNCDINLFHVLAYPRGKALVTLYLFLVLISVNLDPHLLLKPTCVFEEKWERIVEIMDMRQAFDIKARLTLGHYRYLI